MLHTAALVLFIMYPAVLVADRLSDRPARLRSVTGVLAVAAGPTVASLDPIVRQIKPRQVYTNYLNGELEGRNLVLVDLAAACLVGAVFVRTVASSSVGHVALCSTVIDATFAWLGFHTAYVRRGGLCFEPFAFILIRQIIDSTKALSVRMILRWGFVAFRITYFWEAGILVGHSSVTPYHKGGLA